MTIELLPDSRAKNTKNRIFRGSEAWVPVFCANCGKEGGWCPEENMTFLFYQCYPCSEKYGEIAGTLKMPDEVFFEKLKNAQLEEHGEFLDSQELAKIVEEDASPLATLLLEAK